MHNDARVVCIVTISEDGGRGRRRGWIKRRRRRRRGTRSRRRGGGGGGGGGGGDEEEGEEEEEEEGVEGFRKGQKRWHSGSGVVKMRVAKESIRGKNSSKCQWEGPKALQQQPQQPTSRQLKESKEKWFKRQRIHLPVNWSGEKHLHCHTPLSSQFHFLDLKSNPCNELKVNRCLPCALRF